ncbi:hypothetical protein PV458_36645 [Streptomyces sp. MN03-5084-2B]|nr:hypothetical protein [Streptomyces sp. MN03-5084-2B]
MSVATARTVTPITRKEHLGDGYEPRTIRHSNAIVRAFFTYWTEDVRDGPLINPVQLDHRHRERAYHGKCPTPPGQMFLPG